LQQQKKNNYDKLLKKESEEKKSGLCFLFLKGKMLEEDKGPQKYQS
jgi:hypothetical protein